MTLVGWAQIALYCAIVVALVKPLGWYMTRVFSGEKTFLSPVLRPIEIGLYKISGVNDRAEQDWLRYTVSMLLFHIGGFLIIYIVLRTQGALPFNPQGMTAFAPDLSFNTAASFTTNTNWQNYGGENTMGRTSSADGGAGVAQLLVGGGGHRHRRGIGAGDCTRQGDKHRQLLGRSRSPAPVPADPDLHRVRAVPGLPGHDHEFPADDVIDDDRRRPAVDRARSRRVADRHQNARHQWRRILQRQRGVSV